jgi:hypothetical protein
MSGLHLIALLLSLYLTVVNLLQRITLYVDVPSLSLTAHCPLTCALVGFTLCSRGKGVPAVAQLCRACPIR